MTPRQKREKPEISAESDAADGGIRTVAFVSLGCPKNLVDSEKMLGLLAADGLVPTSDHDDADAIVVNTCGFLEESKVESLEVIAEAAERKRAGKVKRLVVAGCLVQRHRAKMLEWCPDIDAMVGVFDRDRVVEAVRGVAPKRTGIGEENGTPKYWVASNAIAAAKDRGMATIGLTVNGRNGGRGIGYFESDAARLRLTPRHYAYLRVSEGCNQTCTFCTIPSIRGLMRSKPIEAIKAEARELMADGAFEINLIGQDTTSYGRDLGYEAGLAGMLGELNGVAKEFGGAWLRLMYVYPTSFTDEMIEAIADLEHVVKYLDIPLQHINDRILGAMKRNTTRGQTEALLARLRERVAGLSIRTTFITGFPGESEAEHRELVEFVREFGFDMMGVFKYSTEEGTPAGRMDLEGGLGVAGEVKERRYDELMRVQQGVAFAKSAAMAREGMKVEVLIDGATKTAGRATAGVAAKGGRVWVGRTKQQAPQVDSVTYVRAQESLSPGEVVECVVVDSDGYDMVAVPAVEITRRTRLPVVSR